MSSRILLSFRLTLAIMAVALLAAARSRVAPNGASCPAGTYSVTVSAPNANWTTSSGALWTPSGSFPGAGSCDAAINTGVSNTITVDSVIPNPLYTLDFNCSSCVIDIQPGGQLTIGNSGSLAGTAKININGGTLVIDAPPASGGFSLGSGTEIALNSGTLSGTGELNIGANAYLGVSSSGAAIDGLTINNAGTIALLPAGPTTVALNNGATINNSNYITLGNVSISSSGGGTINNNGSIDVSGGGTDTIDATFNNTSGTGVNITSATLRITADGTGNAPFAIAGGSTLEFQSGTYTLGAGATIDGGGLLSITGGTLSIGGVTSPANFNLSSGTLDGAGFLSVDGTFDWSGGTIKGTGGTEVAGTGIGNFSGSNGPMFLDERTLNVYGTVNFTATTNSLDLDNNATLAIYGTFDFQDDGSITDSSGGSASVLISPNGLLKKTGGSKTSTIHPTTTNDWTVNVFSGTLEFAGSGTHTGQFYAAADTTLQFSALNTILDTNSGVYADGTVDIASGTTTINGTFSIAGTTSISGGTLGVQQAATTNDFVLTDGVLGLGAGFTMTGDGTWSQGSISGPIGPFTVDTGATLVIDAATCEPSLDFVELINNGTITYTQTAPSGNDWVMFASTLTNNGLFDIQGDAPILEGGLVAEFDEAGGGSGCASASRKRVRNRIGTDELPLLPAQIVNNGTWKKSGGGTTDIEPSFSTSDTVQAQAGVMHFAGAFDQSGGTTTLAGGDIKVDSTMNLAAGTLDGDGTIDGNLQNGGTVAPSALPVLAGRMRPKSSLILLPGGTATINVTGNYTQTSGGTMAIDIEGPAAFDQLAVTGTSTLAGTFVAQLIGGYTPATGATWPVHTYASYSGAFATETLPPMITSTYTLTAYVLAASNPSADLSAGMTGPASINAGAALNYFVTITNNGPSTSGGTVTVTDTLPAGVTGASATGGGWTCNPPAAGVITCTTTATVTTGASLPILTFGMFAPVTGGNVANSATVSSSFDSNGTNDTAFVNTAVVAQADLQLIKTGPNGVTAGQNIVYTLTITNNGPSTAASVVVQDPTPANTTFVSNSGGCVGPFPCTIGVMTSGQVVTITSTYSTSPSFNGNVTNTANVQSGTPDPNSPNDGSTKVTNVGAQSDLQITKVGPPSATPNQNVVYTITFTNNGSSPATGVVVSDPTPVGIAFVSNSGSCATPFPCSIGNLAVGQSGSITSTYTVPSNYSGTTIVNTASISSAINDPNTANNSSAATTNVAQTADVGVTKTGPPTVSAGQNLTYTVTVSNGGPSSAGSVVVSDTTPAGLTFVSNTGGCTSAYPCNIGVLTSGQSTTIASTYNVPSSYVGAAVVNTATVTSGATDANGANNSATATTAVLAQADLAITKTGPGSFSQGQNIVYTISVTNNGPLPATNTFVTDATPPGLTFVSNSGACTTSFPCALGTINANQTVTITSTFNVAPNFAGASVTNTASVSSSSLDTILANNSSSTTANVTASAADVAITKTGPGGARQFDIINFTIVVTNNGPSTATNIVVSDPPPTGANWISNSGACTTAFPCNLGTLAPGQSATITSTYRFAAVSGSVTNTATVTSTPTDANTANNTASATVAAGPTFTCPTGGPALGSPGSGAVLGNSTVTFTWSSVSNAIGYILTIIPSGGATPIVINTGTTSATVPLQPGAYAWNVSAAGVESCRPLPSATSSFLICATLTTPPLPSVVGESTTGQTYEVAWTLVDGATSYEVQEALSPAFANPTSSIVGENGKSFTKTTTAPIAYWYRVRALAACNPAPGPFSTAIAVVVVPVPQPTNHDPNVNVPNGSHTPVTWQIFIPGLPEGTTSFVATVDKPWLSVSPQSGIIPPAGMNFTISTDPSTLTNGTWTGTLIVVFGTSSVNQGLASDGTTTTTVPISISLVTPVTPTPLLTASNTAMIVPSVGHLAGVESLWRSDIRLANLASATQKYQLVFNAGAGGESSSTKTTTISVGAGETTALDDIVRNWYGIGSLGTSSNGLLTVQPLDAAGKPLTGTSNVSAVSSRTFNAASTGTLGQFIPAVPFAKFIGRSGGGALSSALSLQQIAQSSAYRTNLGIVEAAGKQAAVLVSAFDGNGLKLFDFPLTLQAGEQKQLNGFLAANGVSSLANGRVEVRVTGGDGKVTAYASVVDNASSDPILISGTSVDNIGANRFVVPGIADFSGGGSNWRSDMRVFNASAASQPATLTFYPSENGTPITAPITLAPGEIEQLDDVLHSILGVTNLGGALHVTTSTNAPLVVTARTYDQTANGTLGQFIPAVTPNEAIALGGRALQILQAEESSRYRTNVGVVEVTGKAAVAEISIHLADSKVTPVLQVPLNAFESRQIPVLSTLGLGSVYNARVSVRVIGGDGRVTAYGSVIDNATKDPTFIPAQ